MTQFDYASLDAEDSEATVSAALEPFEQHRQPAPILIVKPGRKAPLTDEQRLVAAQKSVQSLQTKVVATRDRMRRELVEDLYRKHSISEVAGDPSEHQRLTSLRKKLGL